MAVGIAVAVEEFNARKSASVTTLEYPDDCGVEFNVTFVDSSASTFVNNRCLSMMVGTLIKLITMVGTLGK